MHAFCGVAARQERGARGKMDIDVLTSIGCVVDGATVAIEGTAVRIPCEPCSMVLAAKSR